MAIQLLARVRHTFDVEVSLKDVIDEFVVSVAPVFIGEGIPLIARRHRQVSLELRSVERFEDGLVQIHYRVQD